MNSVEDARLWVPIVAAGIPAAAGKLPKLAACIGARGNRIRAKVALERIQAMVHETIEGPPIHTLNGKNGHHGANGHGNARLASDLDSLVA